MRRIEHLINDVKFSSNEQSNRFPNARFNRLFNDAQQEIQRIVHVSSTDSKFFIKDEYQDLISGQESYVLPTDIYTQSAISSISRKINSTSSEYYSPLRYLSDKERRIGTGYIISGLNFYMTPIPRRSIVDGIRVTYTAKLAELSTRVGKIKSISSSLISLSDFEIKTDISDFNDYFCIVDKDGVLIDKGLYISSYNKDNGKITYTGTSTASTGDYIVLGKLATTNSALPDACEKYMMMYVERMVHYINSSRQDMEASAIFSVEEKRDIEVLFAKNEDDVKFPPITDTNYLNI